MDTSSESWGSRIMGSLKSVLIGFILFIGSFFLLWINEGRTVKKYRGLVEGLENVISISSDKISSANEGKLVHLSGEITSENSLSDHDFNIKAKGLRLERKVQMYQWVEIKNEKTKKDTDGNETTTTEYTYEKEWSNKPINSSEFTKEGYNNPADLPYKEITLQVPKATLGAFSISQAQLSRLNNFEAFPIKSLDTTIKNAKINTGGIIYLSDSLASPHAHIGDIKISYHIIPHGPYSIIAKQTGSSFEKFKTSNETVINMIRPGISSANTMFESAQGANTTLGWILRFVGFIMAFGGIYLLFKPLVVIADAIPILGSVLSVGIAVFSGVTAFGLSFITIALAWIFYRPLIGISLLVLAGLGFYFLYYKGKKKSKSI